MITSAELQLLRNADPGAVLPGIDTPEGNQLAASSLKSVTSITTNNIGVPFYYNPKYNSVTVTQAGAVLNGYNFGTATVSIQANNVTVENSTFSGTTGYYSLQQVSGYSGAVVSNDTFNGAGSNAGFIIGGSGTITVTGNSFIDAPGDAIDLGAGTVSNNYIGGGGFSTTGIHSDAVWVTNSSGPVSITNNFIDFTSHGNGYANNTVRITTEFGSVNNVTVSNNVLIGGIYTIDAGNEGSQGTFNNIKINNNYVGFGLYGAFYPGPQQGVAKSGNVVFDYTNPIYSTQAWVAYKAAGIPTANLLISANGNTIVNSSSSSTTLYGNGTTEYLIGGSSETNFVGGFGRQYLDAGTGANIFTYLAISDSTSSNNDDVIANFNPARDVFNLSHIDANLTTAGVQNFTFIGTAAFSGAGAQVRYQQDPTNNVTYVEADLAGDAGNASPDLNIKLYGLQTLTAANFVLTGANPAVAPPAVAPTIIGTASGQTTTSEAPVLPFAKVTIGDANANAKDTLTIRLGGAGGGLTGAGLSGGAAGVYTLSGTAATITSELDALSFTPTAGAPNTTSTTTFTLSDQSSAYATPAVDSSTSVIDHDPGATSGSSGTINTGPTASAQAWAAYQAAGIPTANLVISTNGGDIASAPSGSTTLYGDGAAVHMGGRSGETNFIGGFGRQYIIGGAGANIFTYLAISDSTVNSPDAIGNLDTAKDVIDLSHIDANLTTAGVQNFTFIGTAAFSGAGAQVRYQQDPTKNVTYVEADLAGDAGNASPDLYVTFYGLQTLTAANFALTSSQSAADLGNGATLGVSLIRPSAGSAVEYAYTNVKGQSYSSYEAIYANSSNSRRGQSQSQLQRQRTGSVHQQPDDLARLLGRKHQGRDQHICARLPSNRNDLCRRGRRGNLRLWVELWQ